MSESIFIGKCYSNARTYKHDTSLMAGIVDIKPYFLSVEFAPFQSIIPLFTSR